MDMYGEFALLGTNIAPENRPSQRKFHLPTSNHWFPVAMLLSGRAKNFLAAGSLSGSCVHKNSLAAFSNSSIWVVHSSCKYPHKWRCCVLDLRTLSPSGPAVPWLQHECHSSESQQSVSMKDLYIKKSSIAIHHTCLAVKQVSSTEVQLGKECINKKTGIWTKFSACLTLASGNKLTRTCPTLL